MFWMPQLSPMSWILLLLIFLFLVKMFGFHKKMKIKTLNKKSFLFFKKWFW